MKRKKWEKNAEPKKGARDVSGRQHIILRERGCRKKRRGKEVGSLKHTRTAKDGGRKKKQKENVAEGESKRERGRASKVPGGGRQNSNKNEKGQKK